MKIERSLIEDPRVYEIMYFSPVEVGDERHTNQLYFQTEVYARHMPPTMVERMQAQIDDLRHAEQGLIPFDEPLRQAHRSAVIFHCKMALAYLDAREARISLKLCELCDGATKSMDAIVGQHPQLELNYLRVCMLSVKACAARRVKLYQKAMAALNEAHHLCTLDDSMHPLLSALTLLSLSAVLGDTDHDEKGLCWGLEALARFYDIFEVVQLPETVQAYYLALACHNAALLNVKLGRWSDAEELSDEGLELCKKLGSDNDGLHEKLIAVGARARHVPQGFLVEAVNAMNGWGSEPSVWNLSFWDVGIGEIREEVRVLRTTSTLKHLIIEHHDEQRRAVSDDHLAKLILATLRCHSLERLTIAGIDFDPKKVWRRVGKRSFLETSWYASALNFAPLREGKDKPLIADHRGLLNELGLPARKLVLFLLVLGNECHGMDLSQNGLDAKSAVALVHALRRKGRPRFTRQVRTLVLRDNELDAPAAKELARIWDTSPEEVSSAISSDTSSPVASQARSRAMSICSTLAKELGEDATVTALDVSRNAKLGDAGLELIAGGASQSRGFRSLIAEATGLSALGCLGLRRLESTRLEKLDLSQNLLGNEGACTLAETAHNLVSLRELVMEGCGIEAGAAAALARLVREHANLWRLALAHNSLGSEGALEFCKGAYESTALQCLQLDYNEICSQDAAKALARLLLRCKQLRELSLNGNKLEGVRHLGAALESSAVLTLRLEYMGLSGSGSVDELLDHGATETPHLQAMSLSGNSVGDDGLAVVAQCLSADLTELALASCALTAASRTSLLSLITLVPKLQSLDLSSNALGPVACADMVEWVSTSKDCALQRLELASCGLGDEGFCQLVPILGSLTHLGAKSNGITSAGLQAVMHANKMIHLEILDLTGNHIEEEGLHALTQRFQAEHKRSLWNPKQLTSTIDTVVLSGNPISSALAKSTEVFLKVHNPLLAVVW